MRCTRCGICCKQTQMLLSKKDIKLLQKAGHNPKQFIHINKQGYAQLQNKQDYCIFYDAENRICKAYRQRPVGCRLYPIIYSEEEGVIVDDICPTKESVTQAEIKNKTSTLMMLLRAIDEQAAKRQLQKQEPCTLNHKHVNQS